MGQRSRFYSRLLNAAPLLILIVGVLLIPELSHADFYGSLDNIKFKLTRVILPCLSVIGLALAAISFFTGSPNAKQNIIYAILGCVFGFGAQSIVDFIESTVR
jgi:hypothetical protein